jgi:hypothetical protein
MLRHAQVFIAVANSLKAQQEPTRSRPHHLGNVFGSRAQIARRECSLTRSHHGLVEVVKVARGQTSPSLLGNRVSMCAHGRYINLGAESSSFVLGHAGADIPT